MQSFGPFFERTEKRLAGWMSATAIILFIAAAHTVATRVTSPAMAKLPVGLAALGLLAILGWLGRSRRSAVEVAISALGVARGPELLIPGSSVEQALVSPARDGKGAILELRTHGSARSRRFETADVSVAREALRALGRDPSASAVRMRAKSRSFALSDNARAAVFGVVGILCVASFFVFGAMNGFVMGKAANLYPGLAVVLPFIILNSVPSSVMLGTDGLTTRWLGMERFVSYGEIVGIERDAGKLLGTRFGAARLRLASGKTFSVPFESGSIELESFIERIQGAVSAFRARSQGNAFDVTILARGARTHAEWVTHLRAVAHGAAAGLRIAAVDPERLFAVVADPSQPEVVRASAAIAMGRSLGGAERVRIQSIVSASASPRLRIALERACSDDADGAHLAEALAELEARAAH
ncbi:MAG: hypothetical protein HOV80_09885 [Polyangiaceae bacterium]|nr:hypothetical protein [Polyangiaceae bacterium]